MMAKDNTYKKENAFLVLAKRMSRNKNAMFGLIFQVRAQLLQSLLDTVIYCFG